MRFVWLLHTAARSDAGNGFDETDGRDLPEDDEKRGSGDALYCWRICSRRPSGVYRASLAHHFGNTLDQILETIAQDAELIQAVHLND